MDFVLGALGDEDAGYFPECAVEEVCSQHVEGLQRLGVIVVENGHELLHALLGDVVRFSHAASIVYHAELISFYLGGYLLACSANLTPFSIMYSRYRRFWSASASPFTW